MQAPSGGVVTSGSANISQTGKVTDITQSSNKASINWNKFNVANDETVNFKQPNVNSITLNRVVGNEKSIINGALNANGQVWILNSNGVLFGKDAKVNTAGLLATTKELSDTDFQAGNYNFKGNSKESVINLGTIDVVNNGSVILAANEVRNEGTIKAIKGKVHLVGAEEYSVNLNGNSLVNLSVNKGVLDALVKNSGTVIADGGEVYLTTNAVNELLKGVVNNTGVIEANSMDDLFGKVELFAHGGTAQIDGTIKAKGGIVETSGKNLNIEATTKIEASKWLLDPDNMIIESFGGADLTADRVSATAIQNALNTADIELQATNNIAVNGNITWSTDKQLKLSADSINVNAIIENTNTITGGVFFNAANTNNNVIFHSTAGKVIIHNINQLQWMNTALNGKYVLGSNIDASVTSGWNSNKGWNPIGVDWNRFTGKFDGLGHTISNLYINDNTKSLVGLFGATNGATIQNIGLLNVNITANGSVGTLVGDNCSSTIKNSYATGEVSGTSIVGGLVGNNYTSTIENSYATVKVIGVTDIIGGLVGRNDASSIIKNSYATGEVTGNEHIGGLVGYNEDSSTIENSYATGKVVGIDAEEDMEEGTTTVKKPKTLGGLVGYNIGSSIIKNSYATGDVSGDTNIGGLVGLNTSAITTSYSNGKVTATTSHGGGLVGRNDFYGTGTTDAALFWDTQTSGQLTSAGGGIGKTTAQMMDTSTYSGWDTTIWSFVDGSSVAGYGLGGLPYLTGVTRVEDIVSGGTLFFGGMGVVGNPYTITNWTQLQNINNSNILTQDYYFSLLNNLSNSTSDYTNLASSTANSSKGWNPIGDYTNKFTGTFDGANHTISNLVINRASQDNIGLFGYTNGATIKNLGLVDVDIKGRDYVGGLVGYNSSSSITNSYASGTVSGTFVVGGLVGYNTTSSIANSYASGTVNAISANLVGGLVGFNNNSTITNSYASGTVIVAGSAGGLVGQNISSSITNSFYDKEANTATMVDSATYGKTKAEIVTAFSGKTGWTTVGGGGAAVAGYELLLLPYLTDVTRDADKFLGTLFEGGMGVDGNAYTITNWTQLQNINNSNILTQDYYFSLLNNLSNSTSDYTNLASSTANSNTGWNPIGNETNKFKGTFDGTNHTISDLYINDTSKDNVGLFGFTNGATIKNLGVVNATIVGENIVGGLVGNNFASSITNSYATGEISGTGYFVGGLVGANGADSTITNSYATGEVTGTGIYVGGLVGYNHNNSTITDSYATGEVSGAQDLGGLVGWNDTSSITNSYATGKVSGTGYVVGGLVGVNGANSTITNSYATGEVSGTNHVGGLVGWNNTSSITNSHATGKVSGTGYIVGGLVALNDVDSIITNSYATGEISGTDYVGGLVGVNDTSSITNSYASGTVTSSGDNSGGLVGQNEGNAQINYSYATVNVTANGVSSNRSGGLVGWNHNGAKVTNSYATGYVHGVSGVGGLVGSNENSSIIENSYSTGSITGSSSLGGLAGWSNGTITNSFWDTVKSGQTTSAGGGTGKTTEEMSYGGIYKTAGWAIVADNTVTSTTPIIKYDGTKYVWAIAPLDLSYTLSDKSKTYDGVTQNLSDLYTNVFGTDYAFITTGYKFQRSGSDVAGYKDAGTYDGIKVVSDNEFLTIKTADSTDGKYVINKKAITVNATDLTKVYGEVDAALTYTSNGLETGDTLSGSLTRAVGENVNATGYAITQDTLANSNYTITFTAGKYIITPRAITLTATDLTKIYGELDPTLAYAITTGSKVGSDELGVNLTRAAGDNVNTTTGYAISNNGALNSNYDVTFNAGTLTITPKALIITGITAANKIYDGNTNATVNTSNINYAGLVGSENLTVNSTGVFDNKDVGINKTVNLSNTYAAVTGTDLNNYSITDQTTTTANITAAPTPPSPDPKPTENKVPENIIRAAENSVIPPIVKLPNTNVPLASTSNLGAGNANPTSNVNVVSQPISSQSSQSVSLGQLQQSQTNESGSQSSADIRVPASANSQIILVNGGVNLPDGVEQEFYVSANQNNTSNESKEK